ncbi:unnamed protein product, partial [Mesorhabditis belari]|uniref:Lysosome membrane protein 2 n=1 Tax=Mesorhabditis belari TaxID=2138241 RepID=A0AAF3J1Y7_9BILA
MTSPSVSNEKAKAQSRWKLWTSCSIVLAIVVLLFGILLKTSIISSVIHSQIIENSRLVEGSRLWKKWLNPQYKIDFNVWVHSVKNPDEILNGDIPRVTTTGPYVFNKKIENKILSHENGTITFKRFEYKFFNQTASCVTCILANRKFVEAASTTGMRAAATTLLTQTAFLEVDIGELLFDGYKDPFLDKICEIPFMNFVCESILDVPERIGLLYGTNGTADGTYEIRDGTENTEDLAKVVDETWWSDEEARRIRGTEGSLFPPFIKKDQKLYVFITQLCRSVYLVFKEKVLYRGIYAYRFVLPGDVLDQSLDENKGFCNPTDKVFFNEQNETGCWPRGLLEISHCQRGNPPIVISLPNFHLATKEVKESVRGLNESNPETDEILVDIEPHLGAVLHARRVFQVNIEMWKGENLAFPVNLKKMRSGVVPVITVREVAHIDDDSYFTIRKELLEAKELAHTVSALIIVAACLMLLASIGYIIWKSAFVQELLRRRRQENVVVPLPNYRPNKDYPTESYI